MDNSILSDAWDWQDPEYADYGALFDLSQIETESFPEDPDLFALAAADDGLADELLDPFALEDDGLADLAEHPASNLTHEERDRLTLARIEADLALYYGWPTPSRIPAPATRDHWGDAFAFLGEPTEAELLPDPEGLAVTLERGEKAARKSRKKPVQLPDYGGAFPEAEAHVQTKGFWPKPLEDTRNDRRKRAKRSGFLAALEDLHAFACGELEWGKLWLPDLNGQPLYSKATLEHARLAVARHLRSVDETACVWKLERGRGGRFHVEMVVPAGSSRGLHAAKPVTNLKGLADYLCKPADAWACEPDKNAKRVWSAEELERGKVAACEEFLTRDRGPSGGERLQFWGSMGLGKGKR